MIPQFALSETNHEEAISQVLRVLVSAGVVAVPTDTVYGLIGDARSEAAIRKMFAIKGRSHQKAFPIFIPDVPAARKYAYISDAKARFLERMWPGPVTVVFRHKEKLPSVLTGHMDTIGIRVPDYPFLQKLLTRIDFPLAQTSANISDAPAAKSAEEVKSYFQDADVQPDAIIDAGTVSGVSSTVIDFTARSPLILRSGLVSKSDLDRMLGGSYDEDTI